MSIAYDPQSNSIRVPYTKEQWLKSTLSGVYFFGGLDDSVEQRVAFRHEHAHFTSFLSTGLSELLSVIQNWKLTLLVTALLRAQQDSVISVPVLHNQSSALLSSNDCEILLAAWEQALSIEGYLLGLGTNKSVGELFRPDLTARFVEAFDSIMLRFNANRFSRFLKQINYTLSPTLLRLPQAASVKLKRAGGGILTLSSRSVQEAYAITIEVIAEYVKFMITDLNIPRASPKRKPSPLYTVAIEAILQVIHKHEKIDIEAYLHGKLGPDTYWAVALTAYTAMMVPVIEDIEDGTIAMGSLKQLNPAMRLAHILNNISSGVTENPLATFERRSEQEYLLEWIVKCLERIGDFWSVKLCQHISTFVEAMPDSFTGVSKSMHRLSWAARHNFLRDPYEMIGDGGIWAQSVPFEMRFVRTSDDCIVTRDESAELSQANYLDASALYILEAMVFGESWDSCWDKICGFDVDQKVSAMTASAHFYISRVSAPSERELRVTVIEGYR